MSEAIDSDRRRHAIDTFRIASKHWRWSSVALQSTQIILGITAILLSAAVASKPPMFDAGPDVFSNLAYCSASATAILTFLSAKDSAARYRAAFRTIQEMIDRYDGDDKYNFDHVAGAMRTAAAIASEQPVATRQRQEDK